MKTLSLLLAGLLVALLAGAATASHGPHPPCDTSTFSVGNAVRVDAWADNQCAGATVYLMNAACVFNAHVHALGLHAMALHDNGCETGVIAELP